MLYEMRLAAQALRKEGWASVLNRVGRYIVKWPNYLFFALKMRRSHLDGEPALPDVVNFAFTAYGGLIMPLQVRSEILRLLNVMQSRRPKHILEIGTSNGGTLFLLSRIAATDACIISIDLPLGTYGGGYPAWKRPFYRSFISNNQAMPIRMLPLPGKKSR
jgi:hypothetical protein